jgi:hypothetical protein
MIETAITYLLTSDNPDGRTGGLVGLRVYPTELPQRPEFPAVVYHVIPGTRRGYTLDGQDGATPFRFQFDCLAETYSGAMALREALRKDLSGLGPLEVPISPPVLILGAFADNEADSAESSQEAAGPRVKRKSLDFIIWTREG